MNSKTSTDTGFIRRCVIVALAVIATVVIIGFIWAATHALMLIFAALLVAIGLDGLAQLVNRYIGISRHAAVILTASLLAVVLGAALTVGSMNVASQAPALRDQVVQSIDHISDRIEHYQIAERVLGSSTDDASSDDSDASSLGEQLTGEISGLASVTLTTLTDLFVIVIIGLYLALEPTLYGGGLLRCFRRASRSAQPILALKPQLPSAAG